jgi:hypothetical protein
MVPLTRLTHKIAIQLYLVSESVPFAVLAPGGQSENFWMHSCIRERKPIKIDLPSETRSTSTSNFSKTYLVTESKLNTKKDVASFLTVVFVPVV